MIYSELEEAILATLLKQYRCLQVCGVRFTWLGIHKAYRIILVACNAYITEPLPKLWAMTLVLFIITLLNIFAKPYKDKRANMTATLSYTANLCFAIINISKTVLLTFSCKTNFSVLATLLWYFSLGEKIVLVYLPVAALVVWVISVGIKKSQSKEKQE